jgi:hypothetical protein
MKVHLFVKLWESLKDAEKLISLENLFSGYYCHSNIHLCAASANALFLFYPYHVMMTDSLTSLHLDFGMILSCSR